MFSLLTASFKIALNSLSVNRVRSFLTVLGIVIGVSAVIILVSVGSGLRQLVASQFASIGTNLLLIAPARLSGGGLGGFAAFTNSGKFKRADLEAISSLPEVEAVTGDLDEFASVHFQGQSFTALVGGANEDLLKMFNWNVETGRFFNQSEFENSLKVALIGSKVRAELFKGDPLGQNLVVGGGRYKIVGVLASRGGFGQFDWDATVYFPLSSAQRFFGREEIDSIYVKVRETSLIPEAKARLEELFRRRYDEDDFSIVEQGELFAAASNILAAVTVALGGIAAISLLVGGVGIMNIMFVSVTERTKEIGLRKAVGARRSDILWQFLVEAVVLSSLGGILGIVLGFLGSLALGRFLATSVTAWSVVLSFAVSALVGIIFGVFPAYKAAKLDPIEALRYE